MYCKFIKLSNGEDLIVHTEDECTELADKQYIEINDPVVIRSIKMPFKGMVVESFVMHSWMKMSKKEAIKLRVNNIIAVTNVLERAEDQYVEFLKNIEDFEKEVENEQALEDESIPGDEEVITQYFSMIETEDDEDDSRSSGFDRTLH